MSADPAVTSHAGAILRAVVGVLSGAAVATLGAFMLGEYEFVGYMPFIAGPVFGLAVAEVIVEAGRVRHRVTAVLAALFSAAGLWYAGWLDANEGVEVLPTLVWPAAGLGAVVSLLWAWPRRRRA